MQDEISSGALVNEEASSSGSFGARKQRRITEANQSERAQDQPRSTAIINSLKKLQNDILNAQDAAATVLKLSRDQSR